MEQDKGASLRDRTTHEQSQQAVSAVPVGIPSADDPRLDQKAFQPASYEGKPRWLPKPEKRLLGNIWDLIDAYVQALPESEKWALLDGCLHVSPINCAWYEYGIAKLVAGLLQHDLAQAIEARSGETGTGSTEGESAVAESHAPETSQGNNHE